MKKLKVIELFAGVGAPIMSLKKIGVETEVIGISEIEKTAINMYKEIHGEVNNFGDITQIQSLPYCDLLHFSSPCQGFSQCGKKDGLKGQSGLLLEAYRLMEDYHKRNELPKYISYENVETLVTKFPEVFEDFINKFKNWGYNVYWEVLNAKYFNQPQNRIRVFVICIRKDVDDGKFSMPKNENREVTKLRIEDFLVKDVDKKYYWSQTTYHKIKDEVESDKTLKCGWLETACGHETQSNRVYSKKSICPTITCNAQYSIYLEEEDAYRKLTEEELWRINGFSAEDYEKIKGKFSMSAIKKVVGNSICLGPLEAIYTNLFIKEQ